MNRVDRAAAVGLALNMLVVPTVDASDQLPAPIVEQETMPSISTPVLVFDPITQEPSPAVTEPQGENLAVIEELNQGDVEFINSLVGFILSHTPETTLMQERLANSPEEFFNAIRMPNARGYRYYPEGRQNTDGDFHSELDILFSTDEVSEKIELSLQLEPSGTFGQDTLDAGPPKPNQYSAKQLAILLEYTFLIPEKIKALPLLAISSDPKDPLIEYSSGLVFKQSRIGGVQVVVEAYTSGLLYFSVALDKEQKTDPIPSSTPGPSLPGGPFAA